MNGRALAEKAPALEQSELDTRSTNRIRFQWAIKLITRSEFKLIYKLMGFSKFSAPTIAFLAF